MIPDADDVSTAGRCDADARALVVVDVIALVLAAGITAYFASVGLRAATAAQTIAAAGAFTSLVTLRLRASVREAGRALLGFGTVYFVVLSLALGGFFPVVLCWLMLVPAGAVVFDNSLRSRLTWFGVALLGVGVAYAAGASGWFDAYKAGRAALGPGYYLMSVMSLVGYFTLLMEILVRQRDDALAARVALMTRLTSTERMASLGTLSAGLAHEINTPATAVMAGLMVLRRSFDETASAPPSPELDGAVNDALHGIQQIRSITSRLSHFVDPSAPDRDRPYADLRAAVDAALRLADNELRHPAMVSVTATGRPLVAGTQASLVQVFLNLLVNAAHAVREAGRPVDQCQIAVHVGTDGDEAFVAVADNGPGVPEEARRRVFDPFYTTKPVGQGTGLGLAVSQQLITRLGGTLTLAPTPGGGATFRVTLPAVWADLGAPHAANSSGAEMAPAMSILLIDDDFALRRALARLLRRHRVRTAEGGAAALEALASTDPDAILCDVMMPDMGGGEVFARLPSHLQARVIFMTGGILDPAHQQFIQATGRALLSKPFDLSTLERALYAVHTRPREPGDR